MEKNHWLMWGMSGALALAAGRFALYGSMYPCPAALLTVIVGGKCSGWKAALLCIAGLCLNRWGSTALWADAIAVAAVWLVLFLLREYQPAMVTKALIGAVVYEGVKIAALLRLHLLYRYGMEELVAEACLVIGFSYIFFKLYAFLQVGRLPLGHPEGIIVLVCTGLLLLQGIAMPLISRLLGLAGSLQLTQAGAFLLTLWIGHSGGVKEGAMAGVIGGILSSALNAAGPSLIGVLACGGMAAGLCAGETPLLAAFGFSAVTLFFGMAEGMPALYTPIYVPLLASVLFLATPPPLARRLRQIFPPAAQSSGYNLAAKQNILKTLKGYQQTFQYLSRAYILHREPFVEDPHIHSGRMIMAYQFKGMADAVERLSDELRGPVALPVKRAARYRLRVGRAGYARDGQVSGDSVHCAEINRGQYAVALSDGMGNGQRAAEESNLTVQTIYRLLSAGFQPELALRIMNSILLYKAQDEVYSTLDLALLDLFTGELQLYKIGAAVTFIKRNGQVEAVKIPALPMGIVGDISVPSVKCRLRRGDQLFLLSDGITEAGRSEGIEWLTDTIEALQSSDPQTLADLVINKASERCGIREKDDMTAVVVVVS